MVTLPSCAIAIQESSWAASRSPATPGAVAEVADCAAACAKARDAGPQKLKLTTSAPPPLRTCRREMDFVSETFGSMVIFVVVFICVFLMAGLMPAARQAFQARWGPSRQRLF